ncbi:MAG TPA: response regulator transcription factor [Marmoricola sp.]|jgi:DNA-binding NarL/FixJ family response regulator|nr:response regulator transcription factor [Marmoricola sp.]
MTDGEPLRVVIAEDSVLMREGIASLLEGAGFEIVGKSSTADDLLLKVRSYKPHVAIVDIRMPPNHTDEGLVAAKEIREQHPEVGVLVLSQYVEPAYAMELIADDAEGVGYLLKDRIPDVDEFRSSVRRVAEGGSALDPAIVTQLVGRRRSDDPVETLTPREREVLELMAEGRSNQSIAQKLVVTERAVEKHVTSIFGKLRLPATAEDHRRVLAVLAFLRS